MIDIKIIKQYSPTVYNMALDLFLKDYLELFGASSTAKIPSQDVDARMYHKARSGSEMLGLTELSDALTACEETPTDVQLKNKLVTCFRETLETLQLSGIKVNDF